MDFLVSVPRNSPACSHCRLVWGQGITGYTVHSLVILELHVVPAGWPETPLHKQIGLQGKQVIFRHQSSNWELVLAASRPLNIALLWRVWDLRGSAFGYRLVLASGPSWLQPGPLPAPNTFGAGCLKLKSTCLQPELLNGVELAIRTFWKGFSPFWAAWNGCLEVTGGGQAGFFVFMGSSQAPYVQ